MSTRPLHLEQSSPVPRRADRRASSRVRTVFLIVKVRRAGDVGLFRARDISDDGMSLLARAKFKVGERITVEFSRNVGVRGVIAWYDDGCCGVEFDRPTDCEAILRLLAKEKRDCRRSARRLPINRKATSYSECGIHPVTITDVSLRGVGLYHGGTVQAGVSIKLVLETGLERSGMVCWSKDGRAGVSLSQPFTCEELESADGL